MLIPINENVIAGEGDQTLSLLKIFYSTHRLLAVGRAARGQNISLLCALHSFIKFPDNNGNIHNYEPTSHFEISDQWYA